MRPFEMLIATMLLSIFYSFGVTLLAYSMAPMMPTNQTALIAEYQRYAKDLNQIQAQINTNLGSQFNIPVVDMGALVFYSGNLVADLMLNFFFAVPSLVTLILNAFFLIFPLDPTVQGMIQAFVFVVVSVIYFMGVIAFILSVRARGSLI